MQEKQNFWEEMAAIWVLWTLPWYLGGDFNATRDRKDKANGTINRKESDIFNDFLDVFTLMDFEMERVIFTSRSMKGTFSKLDRFLVNGPWNDVYGGSDHRLITLKGEDNRRGGPRPF